MFFHSRSIDWRCNGCDVCIKTVLLETTGRHVLTIIILMIEDDIALFIYLYLVLETT